MTDPGTPGATPPPTGDDVVPRRDYNSMVEKARKLQAQLDETAAGAAALKAEYDKVAASMMGYQKRAEQLQTAEDSMKDRIKALEAEKEQTAVQTETDRVMMRDGVSDDAPMRMARAEYDAADNPGTFAEYWAARVADPPIWLAGYLAKDDPATPPAAVDPNAPPSQVQPQVTRDPNAPGVAPGANPTAPPAVPPATPPAAPTPGQPGVLPTPPATGDQDPFAIVRGEMDDKLRDDGVIR